MTRQRLLTTVGCAIVLSMLPWVGESPSAQGSNQQTLITETGMPFLGPNQALVITAVNAGNRRARVTVGFIDYNDDPCAVGTACLREPVGPVQSSERTLDPNQGLSISADHIEGFMRARVRVTGRDPAVVVRAAIRDTVTGQIFAWHEDF